MAETREDTSIENIIDEAMEFGIRLELAQLLAPLIFQMENHPQGFRQALLEDSPRIAELCGVTKLH